jgi:hypothetical protein
LYIGRRALFLQILRAEALAAVHKAGAAAGPLEYLIERLQQDAQQRLVYRVQTFQRDDILGFEPTVADLDFPRGRRATEGGAAARGEGRGGVGEGWYATVRRTLTCLAQLYRCVPRGVFEGLAQELLSGCAASVRRAAVLISSRSRSELDGVLFSVSQLLALREQIAPFESDFAVTQKALDFSQTRQMVRQLVSSTVRGRLGGVSGAVEMLSAAVSTVQSQVDAKRSLDNELRSACEVFILHCTDAVIKPLAPLLDHGGPMLHAARPTEPAAADAAAAAAQTPPPAAPSPAAIDAAVAASEAAVRGALTKAHAQMVAHLPEPSTHAILFAPVKANVLEAVDQLQTVLHVLELAAAGPTMLKAAAANAIGRLGQIASALEALDADAAGREA